MTPLLGRYPLDSHGARRYDGRVANELNENCPRYERSASPCSHVRRRPCSRWIARWRSSNCCCAPAPLTVREVAVGTSINRTTAHRLLASLHRRGWIERVADSAAYRPGLRYLALVRASLSGRDFIDEVRPTMERLSLLSRETAHLGVLDNHDVLHIEKVDSPEIVGVSSRVGTRAAPHVTGLGKALLASGPDESWKPISSMRESVLCPHQTSIEAFRAEIALARRGIQHRRWRVITRCALPGRSGSWRRRQSALRDQSDRTVRSLHRGADGVVCAGDARGGTRPVNPVRWRSKSGLRGSGVRSCVRGSERVRGGNRASGTRYSATDGRFHADEVVWARPLILERGEGIRVTDVFGQTYIDGLSGVFGPISDTAYRS